MLERECVACSIHSSAPEEIEWWPVRENEPDDYESLCGSCAKEFVRCDCCGDARHESDFFIKKDSDGRTEWWICGECTQCGGRCDVIEGRIAREYIATEAQERKAAEADLMSEVRESLQKTLERMDRRNQTNV